MDEQFWEELSSALETAYAAGYEEGQAARDESNTKDQKFPRPRPMYGTGGYYPNVNPDYTVDLRKFPSGTRPSWLPPPYFYVGPGVDPFRDIRGGFRDMPPGAFGPRGYRDMQRRFRGMG